MRERGREKERKGEKESDNEIGSDKRELKGQ